MVLREVEGAAVKEGGGLGDLLCLRVEPRCCACQLVASKLRGIGGVHYDHVVGAATIHDRQVVALE